jgi:hypothetical protein
MPFTLSPRVKLNTLYFFPPNMVKFIKKLPFTKIIEKEPKKKKKKKKRGEISPFSY